MSALAKHKPIKTPRPTYDESVQRLLEQVHRIACAPGKPLSAVEISKKFRVGVTEVRKHATYEELMVLSRAVRELANQLDSAVTRKGEPAVITKLPTVDEWKQAEIEDAAAARFLEESNQCGPMVLSTPESIRLGNELIARAEEKAVANVATMAARGELLTSSQFQDGLGITRQSVSVGVKAKRFFALVGPSGDNFYPAFFADSTPGRPLIEKVSRALGDLPAQSKYFFFTSKRTSLQDTPLNAMRLGRVAEVLALAADFAERR